MGIHVLDRLGGIADARAGASLLGRFVVRGELFMNSFPAQDGVFLVPETTGRWHLLRDTERVEGTMPRAQMLDELDVASIRTVGHNIGKLVEQGLTWRDALDLSPLVPGMSNRAELQSFERLLKENVGHLEEVCRRPRTHLRVEVERMAVSRARRFPAQAANYLAAHTEDWERPTLRSVVPKRILATVREEQFDIYENRVAVRLVDHLVDYLHRRVLEVTRLLGLLHDSDGTDDDHVGEPAKIKTQKQRRKEVAGTHWRQKRVSALWGASFDVASLRETLADTMGQLNRLLFRISGLKESVLYREVPRRAIVSTTLTMTNILRDDAQYRRVAELWREWARLRQEQAIQPRAFFEEMQDLCRSFDGFALLLTLRALHQLEFKPSDSDRPLSEREAEVRRGARVAHLSWAAPDGAISLHGDGIESLRIVPLCSSLAALDNERLREMIAEADAHAAVATTTLILYPSPSDTAAFEHVSPELALRLRSLSHEVSTSDQRRVGFLPVSPWDIGSVERLARQIRWSTTAPSFLSYPPTIARPALSEFGRTQSWFEATGETLRVLRPPFDNESLHADRLVSEATTQLEQLKAERETISLQGREAVREGERTRNINARKKELHAEIINAEKTLEELQRFESDLARALQGVDDLLPCPTCGERADARRQFKASGQRFSCTCAGCSTTWGTIACGRCAASIPMLQLDGVAWTKAAGAPGWVDRVLGADVLAIPVIAGSDIRFACPTCGEGAG